MYPLYVSKIHKHNERLQNGTLKNSSRMRIAPLDITHPSRYTYLLQTFC